MSQKKLQQYDDSPIATDGVQILLSLVRPARSAQTAYRNLMSRPEGIWTYAHKGTPHVVVTDQHMLDHCGVVPMHNSSAQYLLDPDACLSALDEPEPDAVHLLRVETSLRSLLRSKKGFHGRMNIYDTTLVKENLGTILSHLRPQLESYQAAALNSMPNISPTVVADNHEQFLEAGRRPADPGHATDSSSYAPGRWNPKKYGE
ncbi:MAG: hypothetical protein ACOCWQ_01905 [Nanoarchaeota archaeon]